MKFHIAHDRRVLREDMPGIPPANRAQIARAVSERLTVDPTGLGKPLTGEFKGLRRLRVGDWRVIYKVNGQTVTIRAIRRRRDAYKGWKPPRGETGADEETRH